MTKHYNEQQSFTHSIAERSETKQSNMNAC